MVKQYGRHSSGAPRNGQHFRIGFSDLEPIWNADDEKYKVFCRGVHCSKATVYIGYVQLAVSFMFSMLFAYHYVMTLSGQSSTNSWADQANTRYLSQLMLAITLQVILVVVMIHGVKTERKSFLMPYIVYAAIAVLTGTAGVVNDLIYLDKSVVHHGEATQSAKSQLFSHLLGTLIQAWCLSVVWRCYGYLGDKKVARQIRDQLHTTASAFHPHIYSPESMMVNAAGYALMPQPPPYADTVLSAMAVPPMVINIEKPLQSAQQNIAAALTTVAEEVKAENGEQQQEPKKPQEYANAMDQPE